MPGAVILVTGAAGDIGAAAARRFAADGARVVITDRRADALEAVAASLGEAAVMTHACDQTDPAAVADMFAAINGFGALTGAFINAGYGRYGLLIDMDFGQWRRHIDVNLNGGFLMATGAARAMAAHGAGGAIVINTSTAASHVCDLLGAYAASKAGLAMLARSLASELGVHRIRVNTVMPGVIETSMTQSLLGDPQTHADILSETPAGRLGSADDVAALAAFLLSDAAGYITGAEILVDGGQTIHGYPRWFRADYASPGGQWVAQAGGPPAP